MEEVKTTRADLFKIDPRKIQVIEGFNARQNFEIDELVESIKKEGVLNPISVIPTKDENGEVKYRLIDGERRYKAVMRAIEEGSEILRVPALFINARKTEEELLIEQAARNEGKRFNDYEYAILFERFRDKFGYTNAEIANKFAKNSVFVSQCLSLLNESAETQTALKEGKISSVAVRQLASVEKDESKKTEIVAQAIEQAKKDGKKKATAKNIVSEDMQLKKDSDIILKGLQKLFQYKEAFCNDNANEYTFDLVQLADDLKTKNIKEIFEQISKEIVNYVNSLR